MATGEVGARRHFPNGLGLSSYIKQFLFFSLFVFHFVLFIALIFMPALCYLLRLCSVCTVVPYLFAHEFNAKI